MKRCLVFVPLEKYIFLIILFKPKTALKKKVKRILQGKEREPR